MTFGVEQHHPPLPSPPHFAMPASMPPPLFSRSYPALHPASAAASSPGIASLAPSTLDGYKGATGQRCNLTSHDEMKGSTVSNRSSNSQSRVNCQLGHLEQLTISGSDLFNSQVGDFSLKPITEDSVGKSRCGDNTQEIDSCIVSMGNSNVNVSTSVSMNAVSNSTTSDEDQQQQHQQPKGVDDRKQKRMLSNRESARRSRLRKQQHLDDLRAQVAHLRAENSLMMNRYNIASQQYSQLTDENRVLRSHAVDLSRQLDKLRQVALAHQQAVGQPFGIEPSLLDPLPITSSYLTPYSQQQRL